MTETIVKALEYYLEYGDGEDTKKKAIAALTAHRAETNRLAAALREIQATITQDNQQGGS